MPWDIEKRENEWCVIKREDGEVEGCHPTQDEAVAQLAALNAAEGKSHAEVIRVKEDGQRFMVLISSNAFKDREDEIVKERALEEYVEEFTGSKMLWWHGGNAIGKIFNAKMVGAFLVEVAKELPNRKIDLAKKDEEPMKTTVKDVWDFIEDKESDIAWGASIGFRFVKDDIEDGVFEKILKFETSVLPLEAAANPFTLARVEVLQ
jgi:hypothetical protein